MLRNLAIAALVAVAAAKAKTPVKLVYPYFAPDWSGLVTSTLVQAQGTFNGPEDSLCCYQNDVQCQVQVQSQGGQTYVSVTLQRDATYFPGQGAIIDLYNATTGGREVQVDTNNVCQSYCPLDGATISPISLVGFTNLGNTQVDINGNTVTANLWQDIDTIPVLNITMETDNFYITLDANNNATPLLEVDNLTPFGEPLGQENTTYITYTPGPQNASLFVVNGLENCQRSNDCNSNSLRQHHRLAVGRKADFVQALLSARAEKAALEASKAGQHANAYKTLRKL